MSMRHTFACGLFLATALAGCATAPALQHIAPPAAGTLQARLVMGSRQVQETYYDIASASCEVRQGGSPQVQELGVNDLEGKAFTFQLQPGTASVLVTILGMNRQAIGSASAIVGIRESQVTALNLTVPLIDHIDSPYHPLIPFPILNSTSSVL